MWKKKQKSWAKPSENKEKEKKEWSLSDATAKLETFCAYQERCEQEVKAKLKLLGIPSDLADQVIDSLMAHNFLNEERFALAYARGKFRISSWGRVRIKQELQAKRIAPTFIKKALEEMTEEESYDEILRNLLLGKSIKYEENEPQRLEKIAGHALRRGFESELVWKQINQLFGKKSWDD